MTEAGSLLQPLHAVCPGEGPALPSVKASSHACAFAFSCGLFLRKFKTGQKHQECESVGGVVLEVCEHPGQKLGEGNHVQSQTRSRRE